jgi:cytochrome c-type biogenesis protein CcmH/NrfG
VIARVALAVVAVVVLAWLGVMERNTRLQAQGVGERNVARADADLRRAGFLNPDTAPELGRAFLYANRSGAEPARRAAAVLEGVLRREPDNLRAWSGLLYATRGRDPVTARRAVAAMRRLDPLDAPRP